MTRLALPLALLVAASPLAAQDDGTPTGTVAAFHAALTAGDSAGAMAELAPEVTIFESGGAEMSAAEYAGHHLPADIAYAKAVTRTVEDQQHGMEGGVAWVLSRTRTTGTFRDRPVDSRGVETILLRRVEGAWRIVHVHWSSRVNR